MITMSPIQRSLTAGAMVLGLFASAGALAQPPAAQPATPGAAQPAAKPAQPPAATPTPAPAPSKAPETEKTVQVIMSTSLGDVTMELYRDKAPITVDNFLKYVDEKFYDGTVFHRVMPGFMIQGGGFVSDGGKGLTEKKNKRPPIKNEWKNGLKNNTGMIAMARTSDPDSATCQFFINTKDNAFLSDPPPGGGAGFVGYCVFGKVTSGMDVIDKIKAVKTAKTMFSEAQPLENVEIKSIRRVETGAKPEAKPAEAAKKGG